MLRKRKNELLVFNYYISFNFFFKQRKSKYKAVSIL